MIKSPRSYGRNCFMAMIASLLMVMVAAIIVYINTDVDTAVVVSNIGTIAVLVIFGALAIPCAINHHSRE